MRYNLTDKEIIQIIKWAEKVHLIDVIELIEEKSSIGINFVVIPNDCVTQEDKDLYIKAYTPLGYTVIFNNNSISIYW